jgi:hypothetical protein
MIAFSQLLAEAFYRFKVDFDKTIAAVFHPMSAKVLKVVRNRKIGPAAVKILQYIDGIVDEEVKQRKLFFLEILISGSFSNWNNNYLLSRNTRARK